MTSAFFTSASCGISILPMLLWDMSSQISETNAMQTKADAALLCVVLGRRVVYYLVSRLARFFILSYKKTCKNKDDEIYQGRNPPARTIKIGVLTPWYCLQRGREIFSYFELILLFSCVLQPRLLSVGILSRNCLTSLS